jgi:hypothetical protein
VKTAEGVSQSAPSSESTTTRACASLPAQGHKESLLACTDALSSPLFASGNACVVDAQTCC